MRLTADTRAPPPSGCTPDQESTRATDETPWPFYVRSSSELATSPVIQKKSPDAAARWPLLDALAQALLPTWHEVRLAGRVTRHTAILREVAHELSPAPDRPDRPPTAAAAQAQFDAYLTHLAAMTPRAGLAAPTAAFVDDLIARTRRYGPHLFVCFDDARIPATTNALERFFGDAKRVVRHADGCGSTTNEVEIGRAHV